MDLQLILKPFAIGCVQQSGPLSVLPLFGPDRGDRFAPPLSGLKLEGVRGYGNVELANPASQGVSILPLHMGYIQDQAQNHALCRSAFLGAGQKRMFDDACCVQQSQGGYLESKEQWFFILPLTLRDEALRLRGQKSYGKLWPAIASLNTKLGMEQRGHLEQVLCRRRPVLTQFQSRFELLPGQTGALFFLRDRLVGIEVAPSAAWFEEVWMPLVCFCYGASAMQIEDRTRTHAAAEPFPARSLLELRRQVAILRKERQQRMLDLLTRTPAERLARREEERYLDLRLYTAEGKNFAGQYVAQDEQVVYASLFARPAYLPSVN
jgi:hypothetical protein